MHRGLAPKSKITLSSGNIETVFEIDKTIGAGGSCVAYKVTYRSTDGARQRGILKEFFPVWMVPKTFARAQAEIEVSEQDAEDFRSGLEDFKETYDNITEFVLENEKAVNYHSVPLRYYTGNNTGYVLSYYFNGKSYDKVKNEKLISIFEVVLATAKAVDIYHSQGFLHLDLKPENIFVLDETAQSIKLFDFDSLTRYDSIKEGKLKVLPAPENYRVPDFDSFRWSLVDYRTDIFELGAMLFLRIFGRAPQADSTEVGAKFYFNNNKYLKSAPPLVRQRIAEIFRKTLVVNPGLRYSDISELIEALEQVIELLDSNDPYIMNMPKWQPSVYSIGRVNELRNIDERLERDGCVFITGIGGLGKSELAKLYAQYFASKYHTVQFCRFTSSLETLVAELTVKGINDNEYSNVSVLTNAKNAVLHESDKGTLIIVDNFNVRSDRFLESFLPTDSDGFKVIFTSRCTLSDPIYKSRTYELPYLTTASCKKLFYMHLEEEAQDPAVDDELGRLIEYVDYNPLIIILVAETLKSSLDLTIFDVFRKLQDQQLESINVTVFHDSDNYSDSSQEYARMYGHLEAIFSIATLNDAQTEILKNATLIPPKGIGIDCFVRYCESENITVASVREMVSLGWLDEDEANNITMHPVVSDLLSLNEKIAPTDSYYRFEKKQESFCNPRSCSFSTVMRKLDCAKHLERRYCNASDEKKVSIAIKIGRLHDCLFQSEKAEVYLHKALDMAKAQKSDEKTARACQHLGDYYREFGTNSEAIKYLEHSVAISKKAGNRFGAIIVEATVQIANCHRDNNDNVMAYNAYLRAIVYAIRYDVFKHITDIADELVEVCNELGWEEKRLSFLEFSEKYKIFDTDENEDLFDENDFDFSGNESPEEALMLYVDFLRRKSSDLEEASPLYKDLRKLLWIYKLRTGNVSEAKALLSERFAFISETSGKDSMDIAEEKAMAALSFVNIGCPDDVEAYALDAIAICEKLGDTHMYAYHRACLAMVKLKMLQGDEEQAVGYIDRVDVTAYSGKTFLTETLEAIGIILLKTGRYDEVRKLCVAAAAHNGLKMKIWACAELILASVDDINGDAEAAKNKICTVSEKFDIMDNAVKGKCVAELKSMFESYGNTVTASVKEFFESF